MYIHTGFQCGLRCQCFMSIVGMRECQCSNSSIIVIKEASHSNKYLSKQTESIIKDSNLLASVKTFLTKLLFYLRPDYFIQLMNQPSTTLLSMSEQLPTSCTVEEAIQPCVDSWQWFKLNQLQNIFKIGIKGLTSLTSIVNDIEKRVFSYIEDGRTICLSSEDSSIALIIDSMYKYFRTIDMEYINECISAYYEKRHGFKGAIITEYQMPYESSFVGAEPITEKSYYRESSQFVHGRIINSNYNIKTSVSRSIYKQ